MYCRLSYVSRGALPLKTLVLYIYRPRGTMQYNQQSQPFYSSDTFNTHINIEASLLLSFDFLFRVAPTIDAVLLSHPDVMHLGALPYAMKHLGLSAPVYATEPVFRLGLLTMYDHFLSRWVSSLVPLFSKYTDFNNIYFHLTHEVSPFPSQLLVCICSY
jgi:hypothetical protein